MAKVTINHYSHKRFRLLPKATTLDNIDIDDNVDIVRNTNRFEKITNTQL